jgi:molecular chaperone GrpE
MHSYAPDVTETTCVAILQPGYRFGERTIRPARVAVAEPQPGAQNVKPDKAKNDQADAGGAPSSADAPADGTPEGQTGDAGNSEHRESGGPDEG